MTTWSDPRGWKKPGAAPVGEAVRVFTYPPVRAGDILPTVRETVATKSVSAPFMARDEVVWTGRDGVRVLNVVGWL